MNSLNVLLRKLNYGDTIIPLLLNSITDTKLILKLVHKYKIEFFQSPIMSYYMSSTPNDESFTLSSFVVSDGFDKLDIYPVSKRMRLYSETGDKMIEVFNNKIYEYLNVGFSYFVRKDKLNRKTLNFLKQLENCYDPEIVDVVMGDKTTISFVEDFDQLKIIKNFRNINDFKHYKNIISELHKKIINELNIYPNITYENNQVRICTTDVDIRIISDINHIDKTIKTVKRIMNDYTPNLLYCNEYEKLLIFSTVNDEVRINNMNGELLRFYPQSNSIIITKNNESVSVIKDTLQKIEFNKNISDIIKSIIPRNDINLKTIVTTPESIIIPGVLPEYCNNLNNVKKFYNTNDFFCTVSINVNGETTIIC